MFNQADVNVNVNVHPSGIKKVQLSKLSKSTIKEC